MPSFIPMEFKTSELEMHRRPVNAKTILEIQTLKTMEATHVPVSYTYELVALLCESECALEFACEVLTLLGVAVRPPPASRLSLHSWGRKGNQIPRR